MICGTQSIHTYLRSRYHINLFILFRFILILVFDFYQFLYRKRKSGCLFLRFWLFLSSGYEWLFACFCYQIRLFSLNWVLLDRCLWFSTLSWPLTILRFLVFGTCNITFDRNQRWFFLYPIYNRRFQFFIILCMNSCDQTDMLFYCVFVVRVTHRLIWFWTLNKETFCEIVVWVGESG